MCLSASFPCAERRRYAGTGRTHPEKWRYAPSTIRPEKDGSSYEIIACHRHTMASEMARLEEMPLS